MNWCEWCWHVIARLGCVVPLRGFPPHSRAPTRAPSRNTRTFKPRLRRLRRVPNIGFGRQPEHGCAAVAAEFFGPLTLAFQRRSPATSAAAPPSDPQGDAAWRGPRAKPVLRTPRPRLRPRRSGTTSSRAAPAATPAPAAAAAAVAQVGHGGKARRVMRDPSFRPAESLPRERPGGTRRRAPRGLQEESNIRGGNGGPGFAAAAAAGLPNPVPQPHRLEAPPSGREERRGREPSSAGPFTSGAPSQKDAAFVHTSSYSLVGF